MEIRFDIDTDQLTVNDFLMIEDAQEGKRPFHNMVGLMARFVVGADGAKLGEAEAMKVLGVLKMKEMNTIAQQFAEAVQRSAVPPTKSAS